MALVVALVCYCSACGCAVHTEGCRLVMAWWLLATALSDRVLWVYMLGHGYLFGRYGTLLVVTLLMGSCVFCRGRGVVVQDLGFAIYL